MAVTIDAKGNAGGGVTLSGFTAQLLNIGVTLPSEGVSLIPEPAAWFGPSGTLHLSNTLVNVLSSVGTPVGNFSVTGGSTRAYTYTLTADPSGYFTIGGSTLAVNSTLSVSDPTITVRASDTGTSVVTGSFTLTIFSTGASALPSMQFNNTTNSMYIPLLGGIG